LQNKLAEYKALNQQLEYSWQHKLEQAQLEREVIIDTLKAGSERALAVIKGDNDKRVAELQAQFKEDLLKLDGLRKEAVASAETYKAKLHKAQAQLGELKEVL
jgi:hypothetical protein